MRSAINLLSSAINFMGSAINFMDSAINFMSFAINFKGFAINFMGIKFTIKKKIKIINGMKLTSSLKKIKVNENLKEKFLFSFIITFLSFSKNDF